MLAYYFYLIAGWLAPFVPRRVGYALCDAIGSFAYCLGRRQRQAVQANLTHVYGRRPPEAAVRQAFQTAARNYFDTLVIPTLTPRTIGEWATVRGVEHLDAALQAGHGAILAGVHLGSPALAAQVLAMHGCPMRVVVEPMSPPELFALISEHRSAHGIQLVPLNEDSIGRRLIRELRSNTSVGLMLDRELTGTGALIPFFDAPAWLSLGPATLALATRAPVLPSLSLRGPDGRVHGIIEPPVEVQLSGNRDEDVREFTRRIVERLEYYIARAPGQWALFAPVWDRRAGQHPRC